MYAKVKNGQIIKYPYGYTELRADNPYTNFNGIELFYAFQGTEENLAGNTLEQIVNDNVPSYDSRTQRLVAADIPVFENNQWVIKFQIIDKTTEELSLEGAQQAEAVRADRNARLAATDWRVVKDLEATGAVAADWSAYRQALRDIPSQDGFPWNIIWPTPPG